VANYQRHAVVLVGEKLDPSAFKTFAVGQLVECPT